MSETDHPLLEVVDLSVDVPAPGGLLHAVRRVSFSIGRGETLCLVGESGCGKSMTALALLDILPRRAVRTVHGLRFAGRDLGRVDRAAMNALRGDRIAMIFQEPLTALNPAYTIGNQLVEVHCRHCNSVGSVARERAVYLLDKVGIPDAARRLSQYPHQLSGGLRQRVMIAMALMCGPDLLIADEPTTALDVTVQLQILRLLADLQREFEMAMILISHDFGVVARIADRVAVMYAGQIVETGATAELFAAPAHPYTQELLACIPILGRTKTQSDFNTISGVVPALVGTTAGCSFRDRCRHAKPVCAADPPVRTAAGRTWRCVLPP